MRCERNIENLGDFDHLQSVNLGDELVFISSLGWGCRADPDQVLRFDSLDLRISFVIYITKVNLRCDK